MPYAFPTLYKVEPRRRWENRSKSGSLRTVCVNDMLIKPHADIILGFGEAGTQRSMRKRASFPGLDSASAESRRETRMEAKRT